MSDHLPISDREHHVPTSDHQTDRSTPASHPAAGVPAARATGAGADPAAPRGDAGSRRRFTHGLQRKVGNRQTSQALGLGRGAALEPGVRSAAEQAYGTDFSGVQIHTDGPAEKLANAHDARAVSIGSSIAFGAGEYRPGELDSDVMLAHELAHVAQQAPGDATQAAQADPGAEALEADADRSAAAGLGALRGDTLAAGAAEPSLRSMLQVRRCGKKVTAPASAALAVGGAVSFATNAYVTRTGTAVTITVTGVLPPGGGPPPANAVTWTGGQPGASQFQRLLPTPAAGVFPITATGGGKTLTVTIHAVDSTPLPAANLPATLRHIALAAPSVVTAPALGLTVVTIGQQGVVGPEFDVVAHLDGANWRFRVTEIRHRYKIGTNSQGLRPISGPGDPAITPNTIGPIIAAFTPRSATTPPPPSAFWSPTIVRAHEDAHVSNFYGSFWPARMRTLENEIETATLAFNPATAATGAAAIALRRTAWQTRADALHTQADNAEIPGSEAFAHGVSNRLFLALIASIRDTVVPPAPTGLTVTPGSGSAALTWTPSNVVNTTGFVVQRRVGTGAFTDIATVGTAARSHTDPSAPAGTVTYRVLAVGVAGRSATSPVRTVTVTP